ncbi:MAG: Uma2 family endonuclease [Campylobacterales bacterium]|nr:Uma2 family endonuclease [Campylobacterales bacterium]
MEAYKIDHFPLYTYKDYLQWEDRYELISRIAYAMSPAPYPKHQRIVAHVWRELKEKLTCNECEVYISPIDWKVNESTVIQPDVALFCEEPQGQCFTTAPCIVCEVLFKATALKDVTTKYNLYEREGVRYYIIIEPESELADLFELIEGTYVHIKKLTCNDTITLSLDGCESGVDFGKVF